MVIYDLEYDGVLLSEMGYILCSFDGGVNGSVSNGSVLKFNNISTLHGEKFELSSVSYDDTLHGTIHFCKNPCMFDDEDVEIYSDEFRELAQWLNRKEYHKLRLLTEEYADIYYEASFNVSKVMIGDHIVGVELEVFTNRPFGISGEKRITISGESGDSKIVYNDSDEEGYIYPHTVITANSNGNLSILNTFENRYTIINNCTSGEVITLDYPVITSSLVAHNVQNDFNWNFFRLCKEYNNGRNVITLGSDCSIVMTYSPIVKFGI